MEGDRGRVGRHNRRVPPAVITGRADTARAEVSYAAGWHRHLQYLEAHLRGGDLPLEGFWTGYDRLVELYASQR